MCSSWRKAFLGRKKLVSYHIYLEKFQIWTRKSSFIDGFVWEEIVAWNTNSNLSFRATIFVKILILSKIKFEKSPVSIYVFKRKWVTKANYKCFFLIWFSDTLWDIGCDHFIILCLIDDLLVIKSRVMTLWLIILWSTAQGQE